MCCTWLRGLGGKSVIQGTIASNATLKGNRVLFLVHRRELCQQITNTFELCGVDFSLCDVSMVQTVARNLAKIKMPAIIITDEGHHGMSNSYLKIYDYFPNAIRLFFTATPTRLDGAGLGNICATLVEGVSTKWLIDNHYLSPYKYYGVTLADTSKLHTRNGDFDKAEVEALMSRSFIFGSAVENWRKYAENKQTIVYCSSIRTSKETVKAFKEAGIKAEHLDATTPKQDRARIDEAFRNGKITVLSNVDLFGEGYDVPDCECVVLLRPTKSLSLHIQQSMRSMRYKPNKTAIILDHVGNYARHGLPDDKREWSLAGRKKQDKAKILVKECKNCFAVVPITTKCCPYCGAEFVSENKNADDKNVDGVILEEISKNNKTAYKMCKTWNEIEACRKAFKYKFAWSIRRALEMNIPIPSKYKAFMWRMGYTR